MRRNYLLAILLLIIGLGTLILINLKTGDKHMKNEIKDFKTEIFGDNVYIFSPDDQAEEVQKILDDLWKSQETNEFGKERYACYFMPGQYNEDISVMVGFYMHVGGLGLLPSDTLISNLNCDAKWRGDAQVDLHSAMEIPDRQDVVVNNVCTVMITGNPGISNIINDSGKEVITPGARQVIVKYENGEFK